METNVKTTTARVFVIEPTRVKFDMSTAEKYGTVTSIFNPDERRPSVFHPTDYTAAVLKSLETQQFDPEQDYIALAGALLPNCLWLASVCFKYPKVRVLMFSAHDSEYVVREIEIK